MDWPALQVLYVCAGVHTVPYEAIPRVPVAVGPLSDCACPDRIGVVSPVPFRSVINLSPTV